MRPSSIEISTLWRGPLAGKSAVMPTSSRPRETPKVLRIITRLNIGGPAIHTLLLTREMRSLGWDTVLVAGSCEAGDGDMSYLLGPGDSVIWVPELSRSVSPLRNLAALWKLWRLVRRHRPDVVHTHTAMAGFIGRLAAYLNGVPVVVHTFHGNSLSGYFSPFVSRVFQSIERCLAQATDSICVISGQQFDELSGRFQIAPPAKFRVVPLGLDLDPFLELPPPEPAGGAPTIGWLGRLVPVKNVPLLLAVVEQTLQRVPNATFVVAGDGPDRAAVETAAARFGPRFEFLGWQADIRPVLARCHLLLGTSHNEGTPVALIQGMAAARPFVATAAGGVVDMVCGPGRLHGRGDCWFDNGVLVDPDPAALANVIAELAAHPERIAAMGSCARTLAAARYRKEILVENLNALYRELIQAKESSSESAHHGRSRLYRLPLG